MKTSTRIGALATVAGLVLALGIGAAVVLATDDAEEPAVPVEPDGGVGDGPIPVEPDGGVGDGPIPVEPDGGVGDTPIPVEPDGGVGDGPIPVEPDGGIGDMPDERFPVDRARDDARGLLGRYEDDLPADVRVARKGAEQYALTEDYVLGRLTVELDEDGGAHRVTSVTVELPAGPETFHLTPS